MSTSSLWFWSEEHSLSKPSPFITQSSLRACKLVSFWVKLSRLCRHTLGAPISSGCLEVAPDSPQLQAEWTAGPQHQLLHSARILLLCLFSCYHRPGYALMPCVRKNDVGWASGSPVLDVVGNRWLLWDWQISIYNVRAEGGCSSHLCVTVAIPKDKDCCGDTVVRVPHPCPTTTLSSPASSPQPWLHGSPRGQRCNSSLCCPCHTQHMRFWGRK